MRTIRRRLCRLEKAIVPVGVPHTIQIQFVSADDAVREGPLLEFGRSGPRPPTPRQNAESHNEDNRQAASEA